MQEHYQPGWYGHRRSLFRLAAATLVGDVVRRAYAKPSLSIIEEIARQVPLKTEKSSLRRYTVNATVTLAGIPLFTKKNVGGACISIEESSASESSLTALQFAAGSWPEHLKGFNRFGMTQEIVRAQSGSIAESAYISFMSSSPEKNFAEARQAFTTQSEVVPITVAFGRSNDKGCAAEVLHNKVPGTYSWRNCQQIIDDLRAHAFSADKATSSVEVLPTFLFAVRRSIQANDGEPVRYSHNAKLYSLKTRTEQQVHAGHFAVTGHITSESKGGDTDFNLWLPADYPSALPVRIQWRARSFLLLTLEADDSSPVAPLRALLNREQA